MESETKIKCEKLSNEKCDHDLSFKLVLIGNTGVGKSSVTAQAIQDTFMENYRATIGFEFFVLNYKINDKIVKLQIWDTCGQEIYRSIVANFYRSSSLAILVYAIDNRESFEELSSWLTELRMYSTPEINIFLIGNKCDLEIDRKVTYQEGENFQLDNKIDFFIETSAKERTNTSELFEKSAILLYEEYLKYVEMYGESSDISSLNSRPKNSLNSFKLVNNELRDIRETNEEEKTENDITSRKKVNSCAC